MFPGKLVGLKRETAIIIIMPLLLAAQLTPNWPPQFGVSELLVNLAALLGALVFKRHLNGSRSGFEEPPKKMYINNG